jgi:uroporphyrinogen III methyltransferase/synthase
MADSSPLVFLVGAGPGNSGLLTLRAIECLAQADRVVYDRLVPRSFLGHAPATAERICVADLPGNHTERYTSVDEALIAPARQGKRVVRLKGGDPCLFGRAGEEAEALRRAGIPYEIVPGVTSGTAAAAFAGIPLTHRSYASAVAFVTGRENPAKGESALDWNAIARFPGTLVVYMGLKRIEPTVQVLLDNGKDPDTPAAAIEWGTTGRQRTVEALLRGLPAAVRAADIQSPALIVIGPVVALRPHLAWFEDRPLFSKHVLVTRPRRQAEDLLRRLEKLGAVAYSLPAVDILEPADWAPVDRALLNLSGYDWLVFTSANGVHAFIRRLGHLGLDLRALGNVRLAAIGPSTAEALRGYYLEPDLIPAEYRSESLAAALKGRVAGRRVLLARADRGRELLREELGAVAVVDQIVVYAQVDAINPDSEVLRRLRDGGIDYVTLTSSNIARAFVHALDSASRAQIEAQRVQLVSISPVTSAIVRELGLPVAAEAKEYTAAGVVEVLIRLAQKR